ncbi:MAG: SRPBCC domain-containing protein [Pseudomonadota bacterium]|nr:SRPBCC domain-containing protein [Pseudomonadota bacterium]
MPDALEKRLLLPVAPDAIFAAWLSSEGHSEMTGAAATVDPDGRFTAWDGYISGTTVSVEQTRIVQRWRSTDFPEEAPDSRLEILLEATPEGTLVTFLHTEIPDGQGPNYDQGWEDFYFTPMRVWCQG